MTCLTMDYPLTLTAIMRRAETFFGSREIVTQWQDGTLHRYTYRDLIQRSKQLALALRGLGVQPGDRVATLSWNHHRHLEAYFGIPAAGAVLHTLNLRLHCTDLEFIINHAEDRVILVDASLLHLLEPIRDRLHVEHLVVVTDDGSATENGLSFEQLLQRSDTATFEYPDLDENQSAAMCYTSGTTGRPKAVLYSHRALVLQSLVFGMTDICGVSASDTVYPVVPMFHANTWNLPYSCAVVGAKQVLAGPHADSPRILRLLQDERVTVSAGVPTIWLGVLQHLDRNPGAYDLSRLRRIMVGGSAVPKAMLQGLHERHGLEIVQLWGMTETAPLGTVCRLPCEMTDASADERYAYRCKQGMAAPLIEIRARGPDGLVPWDSATSGELEVRGAWVLREYYNAPEAQSSFTSDGWLRTGDIVTIDRHGCIQIQDRAKDLIKSGGEWISSVALENALMGHPAVAEAAVVSVAHPKWQERPLAVVVLKDGRQACPKELREYLAPQFPRWWLPDAVVYVREIPRTSAGKFLKKELRDRYQDYLMTTPGIEEVADDDGGHDSHPDPDIAELGPP
jgi:fatty-acyl-CoA synthase